MKFKHHWFGLGQRWVVIFVVQVKMKVSLQTLCCCLTIRTLEQLPFSIKEMSVDKTNTSCLNVSSYLLLLGRFLLCADKTCSLTAVTRGLFSWSKAGLFWALVRAKAPESTSAAQVAPLEIWIAERSWCGHAAVAASSKLYSYLLPPPFHSDILSELDSRPL